MSYLGNLRSNTLTSRYKRRGEYNNALYSAKIFFLLSGVGALGIIDRILYGEWEGKSGSSISRILNLIFILSSLFIYWSGSGKRKIVRFNRFLPLVAAGIPLVSVAWSVDPSASFRQGTEYFFAVLGAIGLAGVASFVEYSRKKTCLVRLWCAVCSLVSMAHGSKSDIRFDTPALSRCVQSWPS